MYLNVKVLKPFGYHIDCHEVDEILKVSLEHVNDLVKESFVEIVVNNVGDNSPYDEPVTDFLSEDTF